MKQAMMLILPVLISSTLQIKVSKSIYPNPFLSKNTAKQYEVEKGTTILQLDKINLVLGALDKSNSKFGKCASEWSVYGSYCNYTALEAHAIQDKKQILNQHKLVKEGFLISSRILINFKNYLSKNLKNLENSYKATKYASSIERLKATFSSANFTNYMRLLEEVSANTTFNSSLDACSTAMLDARSNSLCGLCSGRSSQFFFNSKAIIEEQVCTHVLDQCIEPIRVILNFFDGTGTVAVDLLNSTVGMNFTIENTDKLYGELKSAQSDIKQNALIQLVSRAISQPADKTVEKKICEKFLTIHETKTIDNIVESVEDLSKIIKIFGHNFDSQEIQGASISNWVSPSATKRRLQAFPLETSFFSGDVIMVPAKVDSSYNAFLGATGTSGSESSISLQFRPLPLNLTNRFP